MADILAEQLAKNKNAKYFIFEGKSNTADQAYMHKMDTKMVIPMVYLDKSIIPDSDFHCEAMWIKPGENPFKVGGQAPRNGIEEHTHDYGELIGFFGYNYDNIHDLGAEIEIWIDGEQHIIKETFVAFVPPGVKHGPINIRNVVRPVMHLTAGPNKKNK